MALSNSGRTAALIPSNLERHLRKPNPSPRPRAGATAPSATISSPNPTARSIHAEFSHSIKITLPLAAMALELLLARDGHVHRLGDFEIDEALDAVTLREAA